MNVSATALAIIFLSISSQTRADNYITCQFERGHDTHCVVTEFDLRVASDIQQELQVGYKFACIGDDVTVGIQEGSTKAFFRFEQSKDWKSLPLITGFGPFKIFDTDHAWTEGAYFQEGCSMDIKVEKSDLARSERNRLVDLVRAAKKANDVVKATEPLLSNVAIFKTILNQLDIPSIVALMREKYDSVLALKKGFDTANNKPASDALVLVLDDLKLSICVNPVLAEKNKDICETPQQTPTIEKKDLVERAKEALTQIETSVDSIKTASASAASDVLVTISKLLGYANDDTKKGALDDLCPALKNLKVTNTICPKEQ